MTLRDAVRMLEALFLSGEPLPASHPGPGKDPTSDGPDCAR